MHANRIRTMFATKTMQLALAAHMTSALKLILMSALLEVAT